MIIRRTRSLDGFVRGYRALARLPPPVLGPVPVTTLLEDAAALFRPRWEKLGVTLVVHGAAPDTIVHCDAGQLLQALLNLLTNAAEATLGDGADALRDVALAARSSGNYVTFLVSDSGPGVLAGQEEAIFRPFFTTKSDGDGIGLALARQIALAHGGTVRLVRPGPLAGATVALDVHMG